MIFSDCMSLTADVHYNVADAFLNSFPVKACSCLWKSFHHELNTFSTYICQAYPSTKYVCLRFLEISPGSMYLLFVKAFSHSQL